MTLDEFAQSIKTKYPTYNSVPNTTLVSSIVSKYPQYSGYANMNVDGSASVSPTQGASSGQLFNSIFQKAENAAPGSTDIIPGWDASKIGPVLDSLSSGVQGAGKELSAAIEENWPGVQNAQNKSQASVDQLAKVQDQLIATQKTMKAAGKDTSQIDSLIADNNTKLQTYGYNANTPAGANDTPGQVVGNFGEMAIDILASGELQKGAESFSLLNDAQKARLAAMGVTDETGAATLAQRLQKVAKFALTTSLKGGALGYGFDVAKNLQAGQTGAAAATPGWGTLIGSTVPLAFGAYAGLGEVSAGGKSLSEVLATPEDQVYKLSKNDRNAWYENQSKQITGDTQAKLSAAKQTQASIEDQAQKDLQAKMDASDKQVADLQTQAKTTASNKVVALRPKFIQAFADQSSIFRQMSDEAWSTVSPTTKVDTANLSDFLKQRFANDPETLALAEQKLGIAPTDEDKMVAAAKAAGADVQESSPVNQLLRQLSGEGGDVKTVADLRGDIKDLSGDISSAGKRGSRVFTPVEKQTDDIIAALNDYASKNYGVDMSKANEFWSKYAPVRNQIISEFKPFNAAGTQTATGAKRILAAAQGTDPYNTKFVAETEKLIGQPLTPEVKDVLSQLDTAQKTAVAQKMDAEMAAQQSKSDFSSTKSDIKSTAVKAQSDLASKQRFTNRQATIRAWKINSLKVGLGVLVADQIPGVKQAISSLTALLGSL